MIAPRLHLHPGLIDRTQAFSPIEETPLAPEDFSSSHLHSWRIYPVTPQIAVGPSPTPLSIPVLQLAGVTHLYGIRLRRLHGGFLFRTLFREVHHTPIERSAFLNVSLPWVLSELHRMVHSAPEARVLVHCREGISRSVTAVCAYLVLLGVPVEEAQRILRSSRTGARPSLSNASKNKELMDRSADIGKRFVRQVRADILASVGPTSWD